MLPNSGYFSRFICPDAKAGVCTRPYCHYGGHTTQFGAVAAEVMSPFPIMNAASNGIQQVDTRTSAIDPLADAAVPAYSSVPTDHFQGYQGYFASSSSPPPPVPKRPLLPTPPIVAPIRPTRPAQHVRPQIQQRPRPQGSPPRKPMPAQNQPKKPESNLNSLARDLAVINNEIERLQKKLAGSNDPMDGVGDETAHLESVCAVGDVPGYDPEEPVAKRSRLLSGQESANGTDSSSDEQYRPETGSTTGAVSAYKPTPIGTYQKSDKPKNKLLKDSWIAESDAKAKKATITTKKIAPKAKPIVKSAALLEKKETKKAVSSSSTVLDLFGDDSDSDGAPTTAIRGTTFAKAPTSIKSKQQPEDMASIIDELITTPSQPPEKAGTSKKELGAISGMPNSKKRIAQVSSSTVEATKKLREIGGERPKGHLMTARQQLESRIAQLTKMQEDLNANQRESGIGRQKKQVSSKPSSSSDIGTHPKGEKRMARVPKPVVPPKGDSKRPVLPIEVGAKVPTNIRQQYLNLISDEFLKFLNEREAYEQALEEERSVYMRATSRPNYLNAIVNAIKRIRDISASSSQDTEAQNRKAAISISHSAVIGGKPATKHSYTVGRSGAKTTSGIIDRRSSSNMTGEELYETLLPFVLSVEQQASNGFPRPDADKPGCAVYHKVEIQKMYINDEELKRICIRCGKLFLLTPDGEYVWRDDCIFHWGRAWKRRISGMVESRYTCCQDDLNSAGCSISRYHVSDCMPRRALNGYVHTSDRPTGYRSSEAKAFALDCEMVYTTCGNELARVTVVNDQCQVVYERIVRPENTILDYNTRFSGLTEDLLLNNNAAVSLADVQNDLVNLFTADTILIGHSLESDFRALKLIHDKVVDTSVVFPHRLGAPYKRALKTLAVEFLKKIIQDDADGHDSKEDAVTCMDLMKWRVKQERR